MVKLESRRGFLQFLAGSPLLAMAGRVFGEDTSIITDPKDAINVFDFHEVAKKTLPVAHYGYMLTSVDDDAIRRQNRDGFDKFQLKVQVSST